MKEAKRKLELLAPAADKATAIQALLHGADAVYMGGPTHGARSKASNSVADIYEVVDFAHIFDARVYVTVNTLVYEKEMEAVEKLVRELYEAGVDALIVQDMALLRMDLPPIALHASTQCDTRTVDKARFLEACGFSQIVLARELSIKEISAIHSQVSVPLEAFVHGALCVSYSGRCAASQVCVGRSANRGECAQMCRMPYTLRNGNGRIIEKDKYLLSLRDLNASGNVERMALAGISSFKIEGRLKDAGYVKNVTAWYRRELDEIIRKYPDKFERSSFGTSQIDFTPDLNKSFNRNYTPYFLLGRRQVTMASVLTPKSLGEVIADINSLNNGDGISFFNHAGEYVGAGINGVEKGRLLTNRPVRIPAGNQIYRTYDRQWQSMMGKSTAKRTLWVDMELDEAGVTATDERGMHVRLPLDCTKVPAARPMDPQSVFAKLGATHYRLRNFSNSLDPLTFIPASQLTALRRSLTDALDRANEATYKFDMRRTEDLEAKYPSETLEARDNVANSLSREFYVSHGVKNIEPAVEVSEAVANRDKEVMTTRYCLRRELGACLRDKNVTEEKKSLFTAPLKINTGPHTFRLEFDCKNCEMHVINTNNKAERGKSE